MSSGTSTNGPSAFLKQVDALESGTTKDIPAKTTITVGGTAMTQAQILTTLG